METARSSRDRPLVRGALSATRPCFRRPSGRRRTSAPAPAAARRRRQPRRRRQRQRRPTRRAGAAAPAPPPAPLGRRHRRTARSSSRTSACAPSFIDRGGVLKSWRLKDYRDDDGAPLELVPAGLPPDAPQPFSLRVDDAATSATLEQRALSSPSARRSTRRPRAGDADVRVPRRQPACRREGVRVHAASIRTWSRSRRSVADGERALNADDRRGARRSATARRGERDDATTSSRRRRSSTAIGKVDARRDHGHRGAPRRTRATSVRRRRRSLLPRARSCRRPSRRGSTTSRLAVADRRVRRPPRCSSSRGRVRPATAPPNAAVLRRARRTSTCCTASTAISSRAIDFGMFALARRAAAARAEVGQRLRRQLRLVDHRADDPHQPRDVPAAPQERRLDAEDAGDSAGGEGDPGSLREAEDDRSRRGRR